mgnify:CR=1 FL=1
MEEQEITKEKLKNKIGISSATMAKLSKNEDVSMSTIQSLCDFFDCQPGAILSYEKEIDKNTTLFRLREEMEMKLKGGLYHQTQIRIAYNSNHMEGSRLTEEQTRSIYETKTIGITDGVEKVDDIIETVNHFRCFDYILKIADKELSEDIIKHIHLLLKSGTTDSQKEWFEQLQASSPQYIRYKGMVPFNQSTEVLKNYDALLFPTYYEGEGFAGTIIDAFAAGLPVIASDWKYNSEIIKQGITGMITKTHSISELKNAILSINSDVEKWNFMRKNCISEAKMYLPANAMKKLIDIVNG